MSKHLPNFLIVGAAKCGTSTLYYHLRSHPQIFMSSIKEPHFFACQNVDSNYRGIGDDRRPFIRTLDEFEALFNDVTNEIAIGEASTDTLSSWQTSIPVVKSLLGDPRIIILLRNPVERAYSAYFHLVRENREYLSFEDALAAEEERIRDNWHSIWHYANRGLYYEMVKPFMDEFSNVKVILTEDFHKNPQSILTQTCEFLCVDSNHQPANINIRYNTSGIPRSHTINHLFVMKNPLQKFVRNIGHRLMTEEGWVTFRDSLRARLMYKPKMKQETREKLKNFYRDDIIRLQDLLHRDLSIWLNK